MIGEGHRVCSVSLNVCRHMDMQCCNCVVYGRKAGRKRALEDMLNTMREQMEIKLESEVKNDYSEGLEEGFLLCIAIAEQMEAELDD